MCVTAFISTVNPSDLEKAIKIDRKQRNTTHRMEQVETRQGFVKFFR